MFCQKCGREILDEAVVCVSCGVAVARAGNSSSVGFPADGKDWLTTLLLGIFLGGFGVHRFYTGHTAIGVAQLLTLGGCGIWALIDVIMIATGSYKDSTGQALVKR